MTALSLSADLSLGVVGGVALSADFLAIDVAFGEGLVGQIHFTFSTTSESEDKVEGGFLLDVVVSEGSAVFELFTGEDQSLLIGGNSFLVLDFGFDVFDAVSWFDVQSDGLACECFHKDLHGFISFRW